MPETPARPRDWLPERWRVILTQFPFKAAAARELKIDVKTISVHLLRLGTERWGGA